MLSFLISKLMKSLIKTPKSTWWTWKVSISPKKSNRNSRTTKIMLNLLFLENKDTAMNMGIIPRNLKVLKWESLSEDWKTWIKIGLAIECSNGLVFNKKEMQPSEMLTCRKLVLLIKSINMKFKETLLNLFKRMNALNNGLKKKANKNSYPKFNLL